MRLIDADALIEAMKKTESEYENAMTCPSWWSAFNVISEQPTAYDIDKVVEELEIRVNEANNNCLCEMHENGHTLDFENENGRIKGLKEAIEIVKQGYVSNNRKDCEYRHENGNCLKVVGFCTSVNDKHCEKMKRGGVADDVCEYKYYVAPSRDIFYLTSCGHRHNGRLDCSLPYCGFCGKKIKEVE